MWKDWVVLLTWLLIKSKHDINKYNFKKKKPICFPTNKTPKTHSHPMSWVEVDATLN